MDLNNLHPADIDKVIRKLARTMPKAAEAKTKLQAFTGKQLIRRGIKKDVSQKDVDPKKTYMVKVLTKERISHSKNMKNLFKKDGMQGIIHYVANVKQWVEEANQRENTVQN